MQSFVSLLINAGVAGLISPLVSASVLGLALTALTGCVLAIGFWALYLRQTRHVLHAPQPGEAPGLEPTERL